MHVVVREPCFALMHALAVQLLVLTTLDTSLHNVCVYIHCMVMLLALSLISHTEEVRKLCEKEFSSVFILD